MRRGKCASPAKRTRETMQTWWPPAAVDGYRRKSLTPFGGLGKYQESGRSLTSENTILRGWKQQLLEPELSGFGRSSQSIGQGNAQDNCLCKSGLHPRCPLA